MVISTTEINTELLESINNRLQPPLTGDIQDSDYYRVTRDYADNYTLAMPNEYIETATFKELPIATINRLLLAIDLALTYVGVGE